MESRRRAWKPGGAGTEKKGKQRRTGKRLGRWAEWLRLVLVWQSKYRRILEGIKSSPYSI
jgi:hypothetical protein